VAAVCEVLVARLRLRGEQEPQEIEQDVFFAEQRTTLLLLVLDLVPFEVRQQDFSNPRAENVARFEVAFLRVN
jgi:hypothetical protein